MQRYDAVAASLAHSLRVTRRAVWREMILGVVAHMGALDFSFAQIATLLMLEGSDGQSIKGLASTIGRSVAATSRLVNGLVQRDLVARREDPKDRRVKRLGLTDAGTQFIARFEQGRIDAQLAVMRELSAEERALVAEAMELMAVAAERRASR
jgi:DNA-binding MarR family transcriptional regulator